MSSIEEVDASTSTEGSIDEESIKGRFGWTTIGTVHVPYIFRPGDKYCAVRMLEVNLLKFYLNFLHRDLIYNCTSIRSCSMTKAEASLFTEINEEHCDYQFGTEPYKARDLIIRLSDAEEFYNFLNTCYNKIVIGSQNETDRCGFIHVNQEDDVPYIMYKGQKYLPLFYFGGETDNLKAKAVKLEGWDLSYLKFCFFMQRIRNELFAGDFCLVISLNDIKGHFPPTTSFENHWPKKRLVKCELLIHGKVQAQNVQWTKPIDVAPPTSSLQPSHSKLVTASSAGNSQKMAASHTNSQTKLAPGNYIMMFGKPILLPSAVYRPLQQPNKHQPAPINLIKHLKRKGPLQGPHHQQGQKMGVVDPGVSQGHPPAKMYTQPSSNQPSTSADDRNNSTNGRVSYKLTPLPDPPSSPMGGSCIPYLVQNVVVHGKMISSINMKPHVFQHGLLVTLRDVVSNYFNNIPVHCCQHVMSGLGIELYKGNKSQMKVLLEHGKCQSLNDAVPLVQVQSLMDHMPQLKYIIGGILGVTEPY